MIQRHRVNYWNGSEIANFVSQKEIISRVWPYKPRQGRQWLFVCGQPCSLVILDSRDILCKSKTSIFGFVFAIYEDGWGVSYILRKHWKFFVWMLDNNSYRPCFEKIRNRLQICHELRLLGLGQTHKCNVENLFSLCSCYLVSDCNPSSMFQGNTRHIFSN